jgi:sulfur carrier protein
VNVYVNGDRREIAATASLSDLVAAPGQETPRGVAVALDGNVVPRARHASTRLYEGARVEIVTAVQGG